MKDLMADMEAYVNQSTASPTQTVSSKPSLVDEMDKYYGSASEKTAPVAQGHEAANMSAEAAFGAGLRKGTGETISAASKAIADPRSNFAALALSPILQPVQALAGEGLQQASTDLKNISDKEYPKAEEQHPIASIAGDFIGTVLSTAPALASKGLTLAKDATKLQKLGNLAVQGAEQGAGVAALQGNDPVSGALVGGVALPAASVAMAPIVGAAKYLKNTVTQFPKLFQNPSEVMDDAIAKSGVLTDPIRPYAAAESALNEHVTKVNKVNDKLFTKRDEAAAAANYMVGRDNLAEFSQSLKSQVEKGIVKESTANEVASKLGDMSKLTYKDARDMLTSLRSETKDAFASQDSTKYNILKQARDAFAKDMSDALPIGSPVEKLDKLATAFYNQNTKPLNELTKSKALQDMFVNQKFSTAVVNQLGLSTAYKDAPQKLQDAFMFGHAKAMKEAMAIGTNEKWPIAYAAALRKNFENNPAFKDSVGDISRLATIAEAAGTAKEAVPGKMTMGFLTAGVLSSPLTGGTGALVPGAIAAVRSMYFLNKTAEILADPVKSGMVKALRNEANIPKPLTDNITKRLAASYAAAELSDHYNEGKK